MAGTVTARRTTRGRPPSTSATLSRREIAQVALAFAEREGFEQLGMRSLAREIGVSAMALYHHVKDKEDLLSLVVDEILRAVDVPDADFGTWQERFAELQARNKTCIDRYSGIGMVISEVRVTTEGERIMRGYVGILMDGGFSHQEALLGLSTIYTMGFGSAVVAQQFRRAKRSAKPVDLNTQSLLQEWRQVLQGEAGAEAADRFRRAVILAGLEAIKGTMSAEHEQGS